MSLLQLFIQALSKPPPVQAEDGAVGLRDTALSTVFLADQALGNVALTAAVRGRVALSDAPVNPA